MSEDKNFAPSKMTANDFAKLYLNEWEIKREDGKPCSHPGCLSHVTHPCEGCGRIAGHYPIKLASALVRMMADAKDIAKGTGRRVDVFRTDDHLDYAFCFMPGWLFRAYPGGRTILSAEGKKVLDGE